MNGNNIGDLDKYWTQEEMDHSIPYSRCYASDSDDDGPEEEVDEDGLTAKEAERAEIFKKVTGRDIRVPLFRDVSLADGAVVDGGKSLLLGARPISKRDVEARTSMISKGLTFDTFLELKIWLKEFSIKPLPRSDVPLAMFLLSYLYVVSTLIFSNLRVVEPYCN
jgi:hypothetical protein